MITTLLAGISMLGATALPAQSQGIKSVAILPWVFRGGTATAIETGQLTVERFFDKAGYDRLSSNRIDTMWQHPDYELQGPEQDPLPGLPSDDELRHIGKQLGVDLVCVGDVTWHTRSVWVSLGPKTKATCYVDLKMVDMDHGGMALNVHDVVADDTAKESGFQTAAGIVSGGLVTVVSGGPATPHQQHAVQVALSQAFEPWLEGAIGH